jgi:hypothetical protein
MWKTLDELPAIGEIVIVAAWEYGCDPHIFIAHFWKSSLPGQPPKFYLDPAYCYDSPQSDIGSVVHFWMSLPELPIQKEEIKRRNIK